MKSPFTGGEAILVKELRVLDYRKDSFEVVYHFYKCVDSNEQFTTTELDTLNIGQVHNKYRAKYGIPFTDEIKAIREKYGLSAAKMSEVLGLGINVYRQYESGEIPSVATGRLIRLAEDPQEFQKLIEMSRNTFEPHEYDRVLKKTHQHAEARDEAQAYLYDYLFGAKYPTLLTGFRMPDIDRIGNMVKYFARQISPFTTGLNKLMFYADFGHFKQYGYSISGICYKAIQKGPVPCNYGSIYNYLVNQGYVHVIEKDFGEFVGEQFTTAGNDALIADDNMFTPEELATLEKVAMRFKGKSTKEIVDISHQEEAWRDNVDDFGHISYEYGFGLKNID